MTVTVNHPPSSHIMGKVGADEVTRTFVFLEVSLNVGHAGSTGHARHTDEALLSLHFLRAVAVKHVGCIRGLREHVKGVLNKPWGFWSRAPRRVLCGSKR